MIVWCKRDAPTREGEKRERALVDKLKESNAILPPRSKKEPVLIQYSQGSLFLILRFESGNLTKSKDQFYFQLAMTLLRQSMEFWLVGHIASRSSTIDAR